MTKKTFEDKGTRPDRDRRVRQADRLARILTVLRLIQSRGRWNAKAIAQELEVNERTVHRDLEALSFAGVPWYYDADEQSYRVRSDYRFPIPNLEPDEAIGQVIASAITKTAGLDVAGGSSSTTQKIAAASNEETKQLIADAEQVVSVLGLQMADHSGHHETIQELQRALIGRQQISGTYDSPHQPQPVELHLHPIRLCLIKNAWYLIARPEKSENPKTYRVPRFVTLNVLEAPASIPENFDLHAYFGNAWAVYRGSQEHEVRVRFQPKAARLVTETEWHPTQQVVQEQDGSVVLTFKIAGLTEICSWLLGWAGSAEVLEPQELRQIVAAKLRAGLKLNS